MKGWGTNEYRQFLFGHALASYMFNTRLFLGKDGKYMWSVIEGEYDYINTFDLVVDQVFLELEMHPWTVKNELDLYASNFYYRDKIKVPNSDGKVYDGGLVFHHDMGSGFQLQDSRSRYFFPIHSCRRKSWRTGFYRRVFTGIKRGTTPGWKVNARCWKIAWRPCWCGTMWI